MKSIRPLKYHYFIPFNISKVNILRLIMKILKVFLSRLFEANAAMVSPLPIPPTMISKVPTMIPNHRKYVYSRSVTENKNG